MTRVLCLTSWYPPHHLGGYELSCFDVMTRLEARGHYVEVLCSDERLPGTTDVNTDHETRVHRRLQLYFRDENLWSPSIRQRLAVERTNQRALAGALDSCRPDVVSVWQVGAMSLGLLTTIVERRIPIVYAVCDVWPAYAVKLDAWARLFERRPWSRRAVRALTGVPNAVPDLDSSGAFCFVSELTRQRSRERSRWRFPMSTVVYSGIERRLFQTEQATPHHPWRWKLLYAGRFDRRKGPDTLMRALPLLPEGAALTLHGLGPEVDRARLQQLARDLGVETRVEFRSSDRAELGAAYKDADVVVFPSEWEEPFGLVPLEAMACRTPVVATGVGGSGEFLVDGHNCLLYPAGDPASLAAAVERIAADAPLRAKIIEGGLMTAQYFDVDRLADTFEAWHHAAAIDYREGVPPDRHPPLAATPTNVVQK